MLSKKRAAAIAARFGKPPDNRYEDEDFRCIRSYYDYRREKEPETFALDETTWYDLSMDDVFRRVNHTLSTPGEQVLYAWLRTPALDEATYLRRHGLITYMEAHPAFRLQLQTILSSVGKRRAAQTIESFAPSRHNPARLWLSLLLPAPFPFLRPLPLCAVASLHSLLPYPYDPTARGQPAHCERGHLHRLRL